MPKKRKNGGKNRHNRGNVRSITCDVTGKRVPKDKAVKRFYSKPLINSHHMKDIKDASYYHRFQAPRLYKQQKFSVKSAQYHRVVKRRPKNETKSDNKPYGVKQVQIRIGRKIDSIPLDPNRWVGIPVEYRKGEATMSYGDMSKMTKVMYH